MKYELKDVLAQRKTKTVYVSDDRVIKLFAKDYSKADILNEALNQARVEEGTDLNIPALEEVIKLDNRWALVSCKIEGKSLQDLMDENPEKMEEYLELFVDIQLEVLSKKVPLLNRIKDKFKRKLVNTTLIENNTKYELMQRLEGMKEHDKLCHGDFNPSNVIITKTGDHYILDWSHATQGNASADAARTFLILSMEKKDSLAKSYLELFSKKSNIPVSNIQRWIPIVCATQLTKGNKEEEEFLRKWIDIADYQ